mmetsp:Transcript_35627/g.85967  ORF Transcript_35627/g.85967 Transcript_35627/m.85967 type:complete len:209 (-) Transcript_35627:28-654(-)
MVVYILYCKADLENISTLSLSPNADICLSVRNPSDHDQTRRKIVVDPSTLHNSALGDHTKGHHSAKHRDERPHNFAMKWDGCGTRATIRVLGADSTLVDHIDNEDRIENRRKKKSNVGTTSEHDRALSQLRSMKGDTDDGTMVPMLALDCDGLEPYAFHPLGGDGEFTAVSKHGKVYENVDLSRGGDWSEYDLSTGSVSVTNFVGSFR